MRDEYGCLVNQKGTVLCYNQNSALLWQQSCTNVEFFYRAVPSKQGCYAISGFTGSQAYILFADENGMKQKASWITFPEDAVHAFFSLTDMDQLVATGNTSDKLYFGIMAE